LKQVIEEIRPDKKIDKIAIWGRSMGAVTALLYLPLDNQISSAVFDSPFKSLKGLV
jgi:alpha-beta hydrolase superfamily lysophospholipase